MKMYVDLPEKYTQRIKELFDKKGYADINSFILAAVDNQLRLEEEPAKNETVDKTSSQPESLSEANKIKIDPSAQAQTIDYTDRAFDLYDYSSIETLPLPNDDILFSNQGDAVSKTGQLWGLINRIFPIKLSLRVLAYIILTQKSFLHVESCRDNAANFARAYGFYLKRVFYNRDLPTCLTGLPIGEKKENSLARFKNHFVLSCRDNGNLEGALAKLKFVNISNDGLVGLTSAGLAFVKLTNPVFDSEISSIKDFPDETLSTKEIDFLIEHLKFNVKGEFQAILWLLKTIDGGFYKRNLIFGQLQKNFLIGQKP